MAFCPTCGASVADGAAFCPQCGAAIAANNGPAPTPAPETVQQPQYQQPQYQQPQYQPIPEYDHSAEFEAQEISEGKVFGLAIYLLGFIGVIVALLGCRDNKYAAFHIRNWLKLTICAVIATLVNIIPFLGWFAYGVIVIILFVLKIICFFDVCKGKAIEPAIIRNFGFLK